MRNRTYAGPIIEQSLEEGIIYSTDSLFRDAFCYLAVDSGTGELVIIWRVGGRHCVAYHNPVKYVTMARRNTDVKFTVTCDLSRSGS